MKNPRNAGRKPLPPGLKRAKVGITLPPELADIASSKNVEAALIFWLKNNKPTI